MYMPIDSHSAQRDRFVRGVITLLSIVFTVFVCTAVLHGVVNQHAIIPAGKVTINNARAQVNPSGFTGKPTEGLSKRNKALAELMIGAMNASNDPCDDFYKYACGTFVNTFKLPGDMDEWWMNENVVEKEIRKELLSILEDDWPVVSPFYRSCQATVKINDAGSGPIQPWLDKIDDVTDLSHLFSLAGELQSIGVPVIWSFTVQPDAKDPAHYVAGMQQGGLALGDNYYYKGNSNNQQVPSDDYRAYDWEVLPSEAMVIGPSSPVTESKLLAQKKMKVTSSRGIGKLKARAKAMSTLLKEEEEGENDSRAKIIELYKKHVATMISISSPKHMNKDSALKIASEAVEFEFALAKAWHDPPKTDLEAYHRYDLASFNALAPDLPFYNFFAASGNAKVNDIECESPLFFSDLNKILTTTPMDSIKSYLRWQIVHYLADLLSDEFVSEDFNFFKKVLEGTAEPNDRTFVCVEAADAEVGQLLGHYYVMTHFSQEGKKEAINLLNNIRETFADHLPTVWMDQETVEKAKLKVQYMQNAIGFPDHWPSFDGLDLTDDDYFGNTLKARRFQNVNFNQQIGKATDPNRWTMTTETVNAYYAPELNTMVVPAAQLQFPDFDPEYPLSAKYAVTGMTLGHELTHGFDDQGAGYDEHGRLTNWLSKEVEKNYRIQTKCLEKMYNKVELRPGVHVDGKLTLGENVADSGGLKLAYWSYKKAAEEQARLNGGGLQGPSIIEGLTDEQFFFLSYAQQWCIVWSKEHEAVFVRENEHSPPPARCNVPLTHFSPFAEAWSCPAGSPMAAPASENCDVWW